MVAPRRIPPRIARDFPDLVDLDYPAAADWAFDHALFLLKTELRKRTNRA